MPVIRRCPRCGAENGMIRCEVCIAEHDKQPYVPAPPVEPVLKSGTPALMREIRRQERESGDCESEREG